MTRQSYRFKTHVKHTAVIFMKYRIKIMAEEVAEILLLGPSRGVAYKLNGTIQLRPCKNNTQS